jgi:ATP-dependent Clp protease ATP-binding subunit ClpX
MRSSARTLPRPARLATPRQIFAHLDRYVVGQRRAKRAIAVAAYNHLKRCAQRAAGARTLLRKSNVLLVGPTGCGKTHLARHLASAIGVPFTVVDATEYTEAGYYGKDVEVMIAELLFKTGQDVAAAQRGIVFVDEIDKVARRTQGARTGAGTRDIGGEGVQQAMLKLLEGREIFVPLNVTQHWSKHDFAVVDTTDVLFVCAGTFTDLHLYGGSGGEPLGFRGGGRARERRVTTRDLLEYGMLAELLGRLPVTVQLDALTEDELLEVLTGPPDCLMREYREALALDDVEVEFDPDALREVVRYAAERRLGARSLRAILEEVCHDLLFEAPERRGQRVVVDVPYVRERLPAAESVVS